MKPHCANPASRHGFTLIELLLAVFIFGIVLAAINTVFYGALRLQARTCAALDASQAVNNALLLMRRDLQGTLPTGGLLAGTFKIGLVGTTAGIAQAPGIEFYTSTGVIDDNAPWGEVQKVIYQLRQPLQSSGSSSGRDLVRSVTRNLLATTVEEPQEQRVLQNVQTLEFLGYTGSDWRPSWDTTLTDTNTPAAVRVRLQMASPSGATDLSRQPVELVVPLVAVAPTNAATASATSGGGQ